MIRSVEDYERVEDAMAATYVGIAYVLVITLAWVALAAWFFQTHAIRFTL